MEAGGQTIDPSELVKLKKRNDVELVTEYEEYLRSGKPLDELAAKLGISNATLKMRICRERARQGEDARAKIDLVNARFLERWEEFKRDGRSLLELAKCEGMSLGSLNSRLHRARLRRAGSKRLTDNQQKDGVETPAPAAGGEQVQMAANGNLAEAESKSVRITTLEGLLAACRADLEIWKVDRWVANKWEVGARGPDGEIVVEPLFQIKAWLSRRVPEAFQPVIRPVTLNITRQPAREKPGRDGIRKALFIPDSHFGFSKDLRSGKLTPYHDRKALDAVLRVVGMEEWDEIVLLGDALDLAEFSDRFVKSPEFYWTVQPALIELAWWLGRLRQAAPRAKISQLEGNHDARMPSALVNHFVAAYQLRPVDEASAPPALSIERLLNLDKLGIKWIGSYPAGEIWLSERLRATHGDMARANPGDTVKAVASRSTVNIVVGHIHRIEMATRTEERRAGPETITAMSPGCLCRVDGTVPGHERGQHWQQGFGFGTYDDDGYVALQAIPIREGRAIWNGLMITGQDYIEELRGDVGGEWNW